MGKFTIEDLEKISNEILEIQGENEWKTELERDKNGKVTNVINNYLLYLKKSEKYKNKFRFNDFTKIKEFNQKEFDDFCYDNSVRHGPHGGSALFPQSRWQWLPRAAARDVFPQRQL